MRIEFWIIIGYLLITSLVGWMMGRGTKGVRDYFVAGGRISWILLTPFLLAEWIGATATVGAVEMAHKDGIISLWFFLAVALGLSVLTFGLAQFYTSIRKITVGEAFAILFDQKTRQACVIILLIFQTLVVGVSFLALGVILAPLLDLPYQSAVWLSTAFLVALALVGLRGIAWMNVIHLTVIVIAFVLGALRSVNAVGGLDNLLILLPADHLNLLRAGGLTTAAWLIGTAVFIPISVIAVAAMFAAKSERDAKIAAVTTGVFMALFGVLPALIGLSCYVLMPDIPSRFALWRMGEHLGVTVSAMLSIGVIAAIVSTAPGILLAMGGMATRDIFLLINPIASERSQLIFSKIIIPVIGFSATSFALTQPSIMGLVLKMAQVRAIFGVVLLISVIWRRIHPSPAFWTVILGSASGLIWFLFNSPFGIEPLWPLLGVGFLTLLITSLKKKPSPFRGVVGIESKFHSKGRG